MRRALLALHHLNELWARNFLRDLGTHDQRQDYSELWEVQGYKKQTLVVSDTTRKRLCFMNYPIYLLC